jgi:hypothetical protein
MTTMMATFVCDLEKNKLLQFGVVEENWKQVTMAMFFF